MKKTAKKKVSKKVAVKKESKGFVFTGDTEICRMFGYKFRLNGKPVVVDEGTANKLRSLSHFTEK